MILKMKRLHEDAVTPARATGGSACLDLVSIVNVTIHHGRAASISTGVAFEIPTGYVMLIYSRSGHGFRSGITLVNGTGVIDSDYRGEIIVGLRNDGDSDFVIRKGDRIAQAMIVMLPMCTIREVDELSKTARGAGGIGSTGG